MFENIKVGDKVIATKSGYGSTYSMVATVTKVNKASFVCEGNNITITFNFNGSERGSRGTWIHWYCEEYIEVKADKIREANKRSNLINKIKKTDFDELSTDVLEKIYSLTKS